MLRSSERLGRLIEDLILFSTASRSEVTFQWTTFNLASICKAVYQRVIPRAEEKKVHMKLVIDPGNMNIKADEEKISWAMMHLLDNAIKFTPSGKGVTLHVASEDQNVRVTISDEGIGIPADRLEEIFEPFHQLDGSSTRRYGGTGLGLTLVRRIIEAHGSTIQVTSEVGHGSAFEFALEGPQAKMGE